MRDGHHKWILAIILIILFMMPLIVSAEQQQRSTSIGTVYGSSNDQIDYTGTGSRYSNGVSWRGRTGAAVGYISVWGRGWNSEFGWHIVSEPFLYCTNCNGVGTTTTYRCGDLYGNNCAVTNYATHRHYFEDSRIGIVTFYTSHAGNSSSSCHFFRNC